MHIRYSTISIGAVIGIAILVFVFFSPEHTSVNYPTSGTTIVAFGDSLVYGTGTTPGNTFVDILSRRIGKPILNAGVPGDTTADGLARMQELLAYDPKIVILLLGGNDALRQVKPEITFGNLSKIVRQLQAEGVGVVLVAVPGGVLYPSTYKDGYETLAKEFGIAFVPNVLKGLLGNTEYMSDSVHPNDAGHIQMADRIEPQVRLLLHGA